jgi:alcohol/geraniol dehydrogenase (NADP+)
LHLLNRGSFSSHYAISYRFVFRIPPGIEPVHAAPLLGAGATVFSALYNFDIRPADRVAIVGLGGVGHLAVQFARAWGCEVTVLSTSTTKMDDAMKLGASHFVITKGNWTEPLRGTINVLLMVANSTPDKWDEYNLGHRKSINHEITP